MEGSTRFADPEDAIATSPPVLPRDAFEVYEGLRETTLAVVVVKADNEAMRRLGQLVAFRPGEEGAPHVSLRDRALAGLTDLRHVQGEIWGLSQDCEGTPSEPDGEVFSRPGTATLSAVCRRFAVTVQKLADTLERNLESWRKEGNG